MTGMALFDTDDVILDVEASSKRGLLEFLAAEAAGRTGLAGDEILEALKSREKIGGTALGRGVALPHAGLQKEIAPLMLFVRLRRPIDFDAQDDEPVDLVILVLWPTAAGKDVMPAMSDVCRILREPQTLRELRLAEAPERVVEVLTRLTGTTTAAADPRPKA